jgi:hypothetical protein
MSISESAARHNPMDIKTAAKSRRRGFIEGGRWWNLGLTYENSSRVSASSWLADSVNAKREAPAVLIRLHSRLHFQDRIANGHSSIAAVGVSEEFCFNDPSFVGQAQELHHFTSCLMMQALLNHQTAAHHTLTDVFMEAVHWAIGVPGNFWI